MNNIRNDPFNSGVMKFNLPPLTSEEKQQLRRLFRGAVNQPATGNDLNLLLKPLSSEEKDDLRILKNHGPSSPRYIGYFFPSTPYTSQNKNTASLPSAKPMSYKQSMQWFETLFGVEENPSTVRQQFQLKKEGTLSINGKEFQAGKFSCRTLQELIDQVSYLLTTNRSAAATIVPAITFQHDKIGDALLLHAAYPGATIQAASQFNCLEFPSFHATPEQGITGYAGDYTQGPACAIACAAGTVYRNYFVPVPITQQGSQTVTASVQLGQSKDHQINNLDTLEEYIQEHHQGKVYWRIHNGYSFAAQREEDVKELQTLLTDRYTLDSSNSADSSDQASTAGALDIDQLRRLIKIGWQQDTAITFINRYTPTEKAVTSMQPTVLNQRQLEQPEQPEQLSLPTISQTYCSALSVAYSGISANHWQKFATLVLEAAYEATLLASILQALNHPDQAENENSRHVFLTFLGGGVFGNEKGWIAQAIGRAIAQVEDRLIQAARQHGQQLSGGGEGGLVVHICHYRQIDSFYVERIEQVYQEEKDKLINKRRRQQVAEKEEEGKVQQEEESTCKFQDSRAGEGQENLK